ncbi:MAG: hypothetical protein HZB29_06425 [Nitrospinae bacterium]|nr:hypothetical protein [Nitrospinota bacterium]
MKMDRAAIPENDGETLCIPPASGFAEAIARNIRSAKERAAANTHLAKMAELARSSALSKAVEYTSSLGLQAPVAPSPLAPVICSGHQPELFHPGVAFKNITLMTAAKALGLTPLFISVDTDVFEAERAAIPSLNDGRIVKTDALIFPQPGRNRLYETAETESPDITLERLKAAIGLMDGPRLKIPRSAAESFLDRLNSSSMDTPDFTSRSIIIRRAWEKPVGENCLELKVSTLSTTGAFLEYAVDILRRLEDFTAAYNGELERYRKEHKLRYPINPFPNLGVKAGIAETPFWIIAGAGRERAYVEKLGGSLTMVSESGSLFEMEDILAGRAQIRPKAITLSIFLRLFVCDFFIHGCGGAKYDAISDGIMRKFYGIQPPEYACVSATLWPGAEAENPARRMEEIHGSLRDIEQKPELTAPPGAEAAALTGEKARLVEAIKYPGADRKAIGRRIKEINSALSAMQEPARKALAGELEHLTSLEKQWQAATARDYPFFIFDPARLVRIAGKEL